jgi:hypothetical protein
MGAVCQLVGGPHSYAEGGVVENEEWIRAKLDLIEQRGVDTLVAVTELKGEVRDIPELKQKVAALERTKWVALGALAMSGSSLGAQLIKLFGG